MGSKKIKEHRTKNIENLAKLIEKYNGTPPSRESLTGFFKEGYAKIRGVTGDKGVMKALHTNLNSIRNSYKDVLKLNIPYKVRQVVQDIYDNVDEETRDIEREIEKLK